METKGLIRRIAKADFADVLGVAVRGDVLAVAHVRKRVNAVRVIEIARLALGGPAEARVSAGAAFLRSFASRAELEPSRVAVAIDRSATLIASSTLPAAATASVVEAMRYELDRLFPVPPESLAWSVATRSVGTVGERIAATVFASPPPAVDEAAEMVRQAGLPISAVTVEPVALADYLGHAGVALAAVRTRPAGRDFVTLVAEGAVVASHHAARGRTLAECAAREIESSLPERSGEAPVLVAAEPSEGEQGFAALAPEGFLPVGAEVAEAEAVAIGAALGAAGEGRDPVNLLPASQVQAAAGFGIRELALSGAVAAMALVLFASIAAKNWSIDASLSAAVGELEPRVEQALRRRDKNAEMLETMDRLESKSRSRVLTYLKAVTDLVPVTSYLTTFRFREDRVEIDGISDRASDLIAILEASPYFTGVEFTAPTTKYLAAQERFSLRMRLEQ